MEKGKKTIKICVLTVFGLCVTAYLCILVSLPLMERGLHDPLGSLKAKSAAEEYLQDRYPDRKTSVAWPTKSIKNGNFAARVTQGDDQTVFYVFFDPERGRCRETGNLTGLREELVARDLLYPVMTLQQGAAEDFCEVMVTGGAGTREEMIESLLDGVLYAYPMICDLDGDGVYETLRTYASWQGSAAHWENGLLSKEAFLAEVEDFEHISRVVNK